MNKIKAFFVALAILFIMFVGVEFALNNPIIAIILVCLCWFIFWAIYDYNHPEEE